MTDATEISASDFDERVLESDEPVVVEFFSHSCPHCMKFNPIYKELTQVLSGQAKFVQIDVLSEQNRILAHSRGIRTVPTLEVFYQGRVIGNITGYHHLEKVYEAIKGFLLKREENVGPGTPVERLRIRPDREFAAKFSVVGYQIRWFKKTTISNKQRQIIKKKLRAMSALLEKVMNTAREEALENRAAEIRLAVAPPVYLAEDCLDNWHLGLETQSEAVGEIVGKGAPFTIEFDGKDVETETI